MKLRQPVEPPGHRPPGAAFRRPPAVPAFAALLALAALAAPAQAQTPVSAREMLANGVANLRSRLADLLPATPDAGSTLNAVRQLAETRRLAQRVLALDFPLDDLVGILVTDEYDDVYVSVIDSLAAQFLDRHREPPPPESFTILRDRVGDIPPLPNPPGAAAVAALIGRLATAGTGPAGTLDPPRREQVALAAIRTTADLARAYRQTRVGEARRKSDDAWQVSVLERVRCPQHHSGYRIDQERQGLRPDGNLYRRYVMICEAGGEERKIDFDLGGMGDLLQAGGRQNIRKPIPPPAARKPGVDP